MAHSLNHRRMHRGIRRSSSLLHLQQHHPEALEDERIPTGIVGDRIRQLRKIAKKEPLDELESPTSQRERESTTLGWGRRLDSGFAKPASRNTLIDERPSLPLEQTYYGIKSWSSHHSGVERHKSSNLPRKLRPSTSIGQLESLHEFNHYRNETIAFSRIQPNDPVAIDVSPSPPLHIHHFRDTPNPLTRSSPSVSSIRRRQDAMEIFEQYGISRPGGWLSEDGSVVFVEPTLSQTKRFRVCHAYGEALDSRKYCPHCGHDSCLKCTSEIPDDELERTNDSMRHHEYRTIEHSLKQTVHRVEKSGQHHVHSTEDVIQTVRRRGTPNADSPGSQAPKPQVHIEETLPDRASLSPLPPPPPPLSNRIRIKPTPLTARTVLSAMVKNNPFLIADREAKARATTPKTTVRNANAKKAPRLSDCVPRRKPQRSSGSLGDEGRCSNPGCRATHAGHHPFRHSIGCAAHRGSAKEINKSWNLDVINTDEVSKSERRVHSPLHGDLQKRIDQLYHHAEDLHHSQHIMEHLAAGSRILDQRAAEKKPAGAPIAVSARMKMEPFPRDHSLARDDMTMVRYEIPPHSLSIDIGQTEPGPAKTHALAYDDIVVLDDLSPRSHSLPHDILTRAAESVKPHSIHQDLGFEDEEEKTPFLGKSFPPLESTSSGLRLRKANEELPLSLEQPQNLFKRNLYPSPKSDGLKYSKVVVEHKGSSGRHDFLFAGSSTLQTLSHGPKNSEKSPESVQEKAWLRRVPTTPEKQSREDIGASNLSSWRQQLRKVDKSEERPLEKPPTPPVVKWRRSLSKPPPTPQPHAIGKSACTFCHLTGSSSPTQEETISQLGIEHDTVRMSGHKESLYVKSPSPRLRLKQVEMSLAQKSDKHLAEGSCSDTEEKEVARTREMGKIEHGRTTSQVSYKETATITEIHNPKPLLPPNHVCAWRTRYMDLSTEVDQLKSEASSAAFEERRVGAPLVERSDVGVGTELDQHQCPEIRIEGLTIVMHMRGKDDLVINTNLKDEHGSRRRRR